MEIIALLYVSFLGFCNQSAVKAGDLRLNVLRQLSTSALNMELLFLLNQVEPCGCPLKVMSFKKYVTFTSYSDWDSVSVLIVITALRLH